MPREAPVTRTTQSSGIDETDAPMQKFYTGTRKIVLLAFVAWCGRRVKWGWRCYVPQYTRVLHSHHTHECARHRYTCYMFVYIYCNIYTCTRKRASSLFFSCPSDFHWICHLIAFMHTGRKGRLMKVLSLLPSFSTCHAPRSPPQICIAPFWHSPAQA